jgi:hypothetical protein
VWSCVEFTSIERKVDAMCRRRRSGGAGLEHPLNGAQADAGSSCDCAA